MGGFLVPIIHLFVLSSFAVAQPILDLIARNPTFLVAHRSQTSDIFVLVVVLVFLVPLPLVIVEVVARLFGRKAQAVTHIVLVSLLAGAIVLPPLKRLTDLSAVHLLGVALLIGFAFGFLYHRFNGIRWVVMGLVLALPVFAFVFLANPSVSRLMMGAPRDPGRAASVKSTTPIIFVVFDELALTALLDSHGQIDRFRYPNLATLASGATWYRDASTVAAFTHVAVPAIVTGRYPDRTRGPTSVDYPDNLFSLFGSSHRIKAWEPLTMLCPESLTDRGQETDLAGRLRLLFSDLFLVSAHFFLPVEMTGTLPPVDQGWDRFAEATEIGPKDNWGQEWGAGRLIDRKTQFMSFVEGIEQNEPPTLHFLHILLPHPPMFYLPSGKTYSVDGGLPGLKTGGVWTDDAWTVTQNYQRFLLQVGFVDTLVGHLVARLRETNLYDPSLIVVTADHGISFQANESRRKFSEANFQDILSVPLIIKAPHQQVGQVSFDNVETVDILPIIADMLDIEVPWAMDGLSSSEQRNARQGKSVPASFKGDWSGWASTETYQAARDAALKYKLEVFGSGETTDRLLELGPYPSLIGRSPGELPSRSTGQAEATVFLPLVSGSLSLEEDFIPTHVTGTLSKTGTTDGPLDLALAINNVIRATTTTRMKLNKKDTLMWSAIVDESSFVDGENDYALFLVDRVAGEIQLQSTQLHIRSPALGNIPFGVSRVLGVAESGFYSSGLKSKSRWTTGAAELVIPISRQSPPKLLRVEIRRSGPNGTRLRIEVNHESIYDEHILPGRWAKDFDISRIAATNELTVGLVSDTFKGEKRHLGVAVEGIWLKGGDG